MENFLPIAILFGFALIVCVSIFILTHLLGPNLASSAAKFTAYECGATPEGDARTPFRMSFYMVAVLFLMFDVEAAFFFPWALVYRESLREGGGLLFGILVYLALLALGFLYIFRKDGLRLNRS